MRSEFAQWLDEMQHLADADSITVAARHYDVLDYYFKMNKSPQTPYDEYKKFVNRWNAITDNGRHTEALW